MKTKLLCHSEYSDSTALFTTSVWTRESIYAITFLVFIQILWREEAEKAEPNQSGYKDFFFYIEFSHIQSFTIIQVIITTFRLNNKKLVSVGIMLDLSFCKQTSKGMRRCPFCLHSNIIQNKECNIKKRNILHILKIHTNQKEASEEYRCNLKIVNSFLTYLKGI